MPRQANPEIIPCHQESFFGLAEKVVPNPDTVRPFHRICEIMRRSGVATVLRHRHVEKEPYFKNEFPQLVRELEERKAEVRLAEVQQVTFLRTRIAPDARAADVRRRLRGRDILATCVVVTGRLTVPPRDGSRTLGPFVYDAILRAPTVDARELPNPFPANFTHVVSEVVIRVMGRRFDLLGSYFAQEDGLASVCAQTCIKMTLFHIASKEPSKDRRAPTSERINGLVRKTWARRSRKRFSPDRGLEIHDLLAVLDAEGARPLCLDTREQPEVPPYEYAYLLIESGIPALIAFCSEGQEPRESDGDALYHVMPVVGHTRNGDRWLPIAQIFYDDFDGEVQRGIRHPYRSTAEWACHLVVHDDILGPFYCMSSHDLLYPPNFKGERRPRIRYVVGAVARAAGFTMSPYEVQKYAALHFWEKWRLFLPGLPQPWRRRFSAPPERALLTPQSLVMRTQLCRRGDYLAHITTRADHLGGRARLSPGDRAAVRRALPSLFWLSEFSLAQTYSVNQTVFGELFIQFAPDPSPRSDDLAPPESLIGMRFMNQMVFPETRVTLGLHSHYPLYRRPPGPPAYEEEIE